ncbi:MULTISPECIES: hypothetical protein [Acetobacter]|jgi:hypothetical protein|uniref:DUF1871 domain-containing protein n=1 Tax=Acetobacter lovaniensis TaxID=104100 RepID=A0A841QI23_9PROT|nr:hypothetical protein [Acetobacter lovaniensis]MBB6458220.1 hypothetical protein [Acetobacter lovaniensis]MCI1795504.1 hypothetical protein [Acetobacter lovaniensis]MCP1240496.1 hypothetical protein [Acetobacter lovaniensis]NHN82465.1 hypothetical protein [Acetobacter lovaniensis]GBQ70574.1 hypothetical protein AA0474_2226 [Acetobacter lovaniensis NRIC 0474]
MAKNMFRTVADLLMDYWDPIDVGDNPNLFDEYDAYVPGMIRLIEKGASMQTIENHLKAVEVTLGVQASDSRRVETAAKLIRLRAH